MQTFWIFAFVFGISQDPGTGIYNAVRDAIESTRLVEVDIATREHLEECLESVTARLIDEGQSLDEAFSKANLDVMFYWLATASPRERLIGLWYLSDYVWLNPGTFTKARGEKFEQGINTIQTEFIRFLGTRETERAHFNRLVLSNWRSARPGPAGFDLEWDCYAYAVVEYKSIRKGLVEWADSKDRDMLRYLCVRTALLFCFCGYWDENLLKAVEDRNPSILQDSLDRFYAGYLNRPYFFFVLNRTDNTLRYNPLGAFGYWIGIVIGQINRSFWTLNTDEFCSAISSILGPEYRGRSFSTREALRLLPFSDWKTCDPWSVEDLDRAWYLGPN